jgi:hypothetical protein
MEKWKNVRMERIKKQIHTNLRNIKSLPIKRNSVGLALPNIRNINGPTANGTRGVATWVVEGVELSVEGSL